MDSMIKILDGKAEVVYIISQINGVKKYEDKQSIGILVNGSQTPDVYQFDTEKEANDIFNDCLTKIESYYQAMMPQNSGCSCKDK